jgi:hypothetical protein
MTIFIVDLGEKTLRKEEKQMLKRPLLTFVVVAISCMLTIAVGFAAEKKYSGFLGNYDDLKPGPEGGVKERYLKPGVDFKKYNKIMLDSVVFFLADDAQYKGINAEEMKELSDDFNKAAVKALGEQYPLVGEPGPDVMRVRVAVTQLEPGKPGKSAMTTVLPVGLALGFLKKGATGSYPGVGKTGIEVEFLDSLTNERIGAAVDQQTGSKFTGMSKWGCAKEAFEFWAGRLKTFLDETHGVAPKAK